MMLFHPSAEDEYFESLEGLPEGIGIPEIILALECLTERQRFVIECRYGLRGDPLALEDIASLMSVSHQTVSEHEQKALVRLRENLQK
jgi:DNA-directed RNA polymerase sigma subunit (sigma70/sigma32)